MLTCPGLSDDAALFHALGQQDLTQSVIDFVRAGMQKIFALEIDAPAAAMLSQTLREEERSRPPRIISQQLIEFVLKALIRPRGFVGRRQLFQRRHQSLGHEAAAITAPMAQRIRLCDWFHSLEFKL